MVHNIKYLLCVLLSLAYFYSANTFICVKYCTKSYWTPESLDVSKFDRTCIQYYDTMRADMDLRRLQGD